MKYMDKMTLQETFHIHKEGHLRKLMNAVSKLQYPNKGIAQKIVKCLSIIFSSLMNIFMSDADFLLNAKN